MLKLSPKQLRFVEEYLIDSNASAAAVRAGYSPKTSKEQGHRMLTKAHISAEINKRQSEHSKKLEITKEGLLKDLMDIAQDNKKGFPPSAIKAIEVIGKWLGMDKPDDSNDDDEEDDNDFTIEIIR